jgi:hypothetical protein
MRRYAAKNYVRQQKFAVKNGLEVAGEVHQPAAVNGLHRQRVSTAELYRTPHDRGPSVGSAETMGRKESAGSHESRTPPNGKN